jgi:hypothetical protein
MPRVFLGLAALLLAVLVPTASVGAEDLTTTDQRLIDALTLLDANPHADQLHAVLDSNHVRVQFVPMVNGIYARYSVARHVVEIDEKWADADITTLAAVIAHEATHAQDAVSGNLSAGGSSACIDSEIRAFRTSALFWIDRFGSKGKPDAQDDLERQLNLIADRQLHDAAGLDDLVRQTYTAQCSH